MVMGTQRNRLDAAIDRLAGLFDGGHLLAAVMPENLLTAACEELERGRRPRSFQRPSEPVQWTNVDGRGLTHEAPGVLLCGDARLRTWPTVDGRPARCKRLDLSAPARAAAEQGAGR